MHDANNSSIRNKFIGWDWLGHTLNSFFTARNY